MWGGEAKGSVLANAVYSRPTTNISSHRHKHTDFLEFEKGNEWSLIKTAPKTLTSRSPDIVSL